MQLSSYSTESYPSLLLRSEKPFYGTVNQGILTQISEWSDVPMQVKYLVEHLSRHGVRKKGDEFPCYSVASVAIADGEDFVCLPHYKRDLNILCGEH